MYQCYKLTGVSLPLLLTALTMGSAARAEAAADSASKGDNAPVADAGPIVNNDPRMTELLAACARRDGLVDSARFVWKHVHTIFPHGLPLPDGRTLPKEQVTTTNSGLELKLDREHALYRSYVQYYTSSERAASSDDPSNVHACNGDEVASYFPPRPGEFGNLGIIHSCADFRDYSNYDLWQFLCACRLLSPRGVNLSSGHISISGLAPESPSSDAVSSISKPVVDVVWWGNTSHRIITFDRENGYRVVRFREFLNSKQDMPESGVLYADLKIDAFRAVPIHQDSDADNGISVDVPLRWKIDRFLFDGTPSTSTLCELTDCEINSPYAKDDFTITPFPVGTEVTDQVRNMRGILLANGELDPHGLKMRGIATAAAAPLHGRQDGVNLATILIAMNCGLFVIVAGVLLIRRYRASRSGR